MIFLFNFYLIKKIKRNKLLTKIKNEYLSFDIIL